MTLTTKIQDFVNNCHESFMWEMANHENEGVVHLAAHIGGRRVCVNLYYDHSEVQTYNKLRAWLESVKAERIRYNAKSAT